MYGPYPWATKANASESRGSDAGLERYLRKEFRGGMPFEELRYDGNGRAPSQGPARARTGVARIVKLVLLNLHRVKAVPTPPWRVSSSPLPIYTSRCVTL